MFEEFKNKVLFVTGAASGMGRAVAVRFGGLGLQGGRSRPPSRCRRRDCPSGKGSRRRRHVCPLRRGR